MNRRNFTIAGVTAAVLAGAFAAPGKSGNRKKTTTEPIVEPTPIEPTPIEPTPIVEPTPAPITEPVPVSDGVATYPFGARTRPYVAGTLPTQSSAVMDAALSKHYTAWKAKAVVPAPGITGGLAVQFSQTAYLTVSEGMGYGMLLAVVFAGHDPDARALFDGLLTTVRARPATSVTAFDPNGKYLMDWRIAANGSSAGEGWNAMDGDEDIAMALLMADKQWGSSGKWNYLAEGRNTIAALKSWNMKPDGTTKGLSTPNVSRTSDYMIGHFRAFQAATGDAFWNTAINRSYDLMERMQSVYSPGVGLMPDFIVDTNTLTPRPSPGFMGDGNAQEHHYWWNACRNPWRFSSDYLLTGDMRLKAITTRLVDFFAAETASAAGDVTAIGTGYSLAGVQLTGGDSAAYHGPICAGACVDAKYQGFLDAMWNWNVRYPTTGYYDGEIQLLSLVVASGNWWTPGASATPPATTTEQPVVATTSLIVNGDFSGGMTGWGNWGNALVALGALKVGTGAGGAGQNVAIAPGASYVLTGTANITTAAEGVFVGANILDAAGNKLSNVVRLVSSLTAAGVSLGFTAPAGAAICQVYVWKNDNAAYGVVDNLALTPS